jgi:hypothetical protein
VRAAENSVAERAPVFLASRMNRSLRWLFLLALLESGPLLAQRERLPPEDLEIVEKKWPEAKRTSTSLRYVVLADGEGDLARPGDMLAVLYKGTLLDGTVFNEVADRQRPFIFRLGRGEVIEGWDQGLQLMRKGSRVIFIVPYELAYGSRGRSPDIPRCATLVFEIHLVDIKRGDATSNIPPPPGPPARKKK